MVVPQSLYDELSELWNTLPPEAQELAQLAPLMDFLDEQCTMPCRKNMYQISGSSLAALIGTDPFHNWESALEHKFTVLDRSSENEAAQRGDRWEPLAQALYLQQQAAATPPGWQAHLQLMEVHKCEAFPLLSSTPDGLLTFKPAGSSVSSEQSPAAPAPGPKLLEVKTKPNVAKFRRHKCHVEAAPHVVTQAVYHMVVTKVPEVDVFYYTQPEEPVTATHTTKWSPVVQAKVVSEMRRAIPLYVKHWLPRFLEHRATAARRQARAAASVPLLRRPPASSVACMRQL